MTLTDTFVRLALGTRIVPDGDDVSGQLQLGRDTTTMFESADIAWRARIISNGGTVTVDFGAGTITPNAASVHQVETATVVAAAGATSSGNLAVTVTAAAVVGSPLAVQVPLVTGTHTTAALIAAAIRTALQAVAAITSQYTVGGTGATVTLTRLPYRDGANDATLNIAIAAGLGVSAAATSANTTAGVAGVTVERLGGNGKDINGAALPACAVNVALAIFNGAYGALNLSEAGIGILSPNAFMLITGDYMFLDGSDTPAITHSGIYDIIFFGSSS